MQRREDRELTATAGCEALGHSVEWVADDGRTIAVA